MTFLRPWTQISLGQDFPLLCLSQLGTLLPLLLDTHAVNFYSCINHETLRLAINPLLLKKKKLFVLRNSTLDF